MENDEIIQLVLTELKDRDIWFTTKNDPTFEEPRSYYELDEYGDPTEKSLSKISKEVQGYIGDGAVDIKDAIELWISEQATAWRLAYKDNLVTKFKNKPVVDQIDAFESSLKSSLKTENQKRRLKEENNKSQNLIKDMMNSEDFDPESAYGKIVLKTSDLFTALSDKGYDIQVAFDNGESQNTILLGQQGGQVNITITDSNKPFKAYATGNFELNKDNIDILNNIQNAIDNIN